MVRECEICGRDDNRIQIRAGTGICCNICEKIKNGDLAYNDVQGALDYLWSIPTDKAEKLYEEMKKAHYAKD